MFLLYHIHMMAKLPAEPARRSLRVGVRMEEPQTATKWTVKHHMGKTNHAPIGKIPYQHPRGGHMFLLYHIHMMAKLPAEPARRSLRVGVRMEEPQTATKWTSSHVRRQI